MLAGRELDALVAEKVMGWKWEEWTSPGHRGKTLYDLQHLKAGTIYFENSISPTYINVFSESHWWPGGEMGARCLPHYSSAIAAAWEVVESIKQRGWSWWMADTTDPSRPVGAHVRRFPDKETFSNAYADRMPLAICRAALMAVGL